MGEVTYLSDFAAEELDLVQKGLYFYQGDEVMFMIVRADGNGYYVRAVSSLEEQGG